ncbi:phosphopantetheine-binding protein [Actinoallomurus acaciae]|uniref:Phosphopantetheine-binding protein n=1 Tax=Actinoallomurus acaciae TaxID=502577 RepID=A0ABV5YYZ4_9ACTN
MPAPDEPGGGAFDINVLRGDVAEVLGVSPGQVGDNANLVALGLDSVKMMAMSARLRRYGVRVRFASMVEQPTVAGWWRLASEA